MSRRFTRRALLQAAQVAAVGTAAGGAGAVLLSREAVAEARGVCRICTVHCGVIATRRGKQLIRVEGDPRSRSRGFLCHHGFVLPDIVHSPDRLRRPLLRRGGGGRGDRGGKLVEVSWEEALGDIAGRLRQVRERHGARALAAMTGWPFVRHPLIPLLRRFLHAFGSPNLCTVASLCEAAGRMGRALVAGSNLMPDLRAARSIWLWGANPPISMPLLGHVVERPAHDKERTLVVVDPYRTELADVAALHLAPRPGTDAALALGLFREICAERLYPAGHVERDVEGFAELCARAEPFTPERVEAETTVPAESVRRAARMFATRGPVAVWEGLGLEHQVGGVQAVRAVTALSALCGYVDVEGGSRLTHPPTPPFWGELLPGLYRLRTAEPAPPWPEDRPVGSQEYPLYEVFNRQAQGMLLQRAILRDDPYPVRALLVFGCNPAVTLPSARRMAEALERLELLVVVDPFLSKTAERADVVLPASTFAESAAGEGGEDDATVARSALLPPQHQSWPDWKVVFELARALDLGRYFPWRTFIEALEAPSRPEPSPEDRAPLAPAAPAPGAPPPRYPTPTGKLELASTLLRKFGADPLPAHQAPPEPTAEYPLRLNTGRRTRSFINSQFRTVASIRRLGLEPYAEIHPVVAAAAGVRDGDMVEIASPHGSVTMRARVTDRVHPEVVSLPGGWGTASANALTDADALDPISGFPRFRAGICRVSVRRT